MVLESLSGAARRSLPVLVVELDPGTCPVWQSMDVSVAEERRVNLEVGPPQAQEFRVDMEQNLHRHSLEEITTGDPRVGISFCGACIFIQLKYRRTYLDQLEMR